MFTTEFRNTAVALVGTVLLSTVSVGAAVGPAISRTANADTTEFVQTDNRQLAAATTAQPNG